MPMHLHMHLYLTISMHLQSMHLSLYIYVPLWQYLRFHLRIPMHRHIHVYEYNTIIYMDVSILWQYVWIPLYTHLYENIYLCVSIQTIGASTHLIGVETYVGLPMSVQSAEPTISTVPKTTLSPDDTVQPSRLAWQPHAQLWIGAARVSLVTSANCVFINLHHHGFNCSLGTWRGSGRTANGGSKDYGAKNKIHTCIHMPKSKYMHHIHIYIYNI